MSNYSENPIIAFINPLKFNDLLTNPDFKFNTSISTISVINPNGIFNQIDTSTESKSITDILNYSHIILIPDQCLINHIPKNEFKLLFHSDTQKNNNNMQMLRKNVKCVGFFEDMERVGSFYEKLAELIEKFDSVQFQNLYEIIPKKNVKLEVTLEFLHNILDGSLVNADILKSNKAFTERELNGVDKSGYSIIQLVEKLDPNRSDQNIATIQKIRDLLLKMAGF